MRQETIIRTIAKFEELNVDQQKKVFDKLRDINVDYGEWHEFVIEDMTTILKILGFESVKISYSGFWSQGDGASFTGRFIVPKTKKEIKERIKKAKQFVPKLDLSLFSTLEFTKEEKQGPDLLVFRTSNFYSHENTVSTDNESLTDFVRDFSRYIYKSLESNYDYLTSDEAIKETIECNEYEFYIDTLNIA